jgi:Fe-S-cluster containining protein
MDIMLKIKRLDDLYKLFDDFASDEKIACQRQCATCCTCNMTLTTLEGFKIISDLDASQKADPIQQIKDAAHHQRFQPLLTTNQIARRCMTDQEIPPENIDPAWGACPLLRHAECPIYRLRPFGCRCMMSRTTCADIGYADIDDYTLTVANLINQFIEHLDAGGMTGNLMDVILFLDDPENLKAYQTGQNDLSAPGLIPNHPIPVLMIPPEHREPIAPLLAALKQILQTTE